MIINYKKNNKYLTFIMGTNCCTRSEELENEILRPEKTIISNHSRKKSQQSYDNIENFPRLNSSYEKIQSENINIISSSKKEINQNDSQIEQTQEKIKNPIITTEKDYLNSEPSLQKTPDYSSPLKEEKNIIHNQKNNINNNEEIKDNIEINNNQQIEKNNNEENKNQTQNNQNLQQIIEETPKNEKNIILNKEIEQNVKYTNNIENNQQKQNIIYNNNQNKNLFKNDIIPQNQQILLTSEKNIQNTQIYTEPEISSKIIYTNQSKELIAKPISNSEIFQNDPKIIAHPDVILQTEPQYINQNNQQILSSNNSEIFINNNQIYNKQIPSDSKNFNNLLQATENLQILSQSPNKKNFNERNNNQFLEKTYQKNQIYQKLQNNDYQKNNLNTTPNKINYKQNSKKEYQLDIQKTPNRSVDFSQKKLHEVIEYKSPSRNPNNVDYSKNKKNIQHMKYNSYDKNEIIENSNKSKNVKRPNEMHSDYTNYQQSQELINDKNNNFNYQSLTFKQNDTINNLNNEVADLEQSEYKNSITPYQENNDDYYLKNKIFTNKNYNNNLENNNNKYYNIKEQSFSNENNNIIKKNAKRSAITRQIEQNNYTPPDNTDQQNYFPEDSRYSKSSYQKKIVIDKSVKLNDNQSDIHNSLIEYCYNINDDADFNPEMWHKFYPRNERFFLFDKGEVFQNQIINNEIFNYEGEINKEGLKHGIGKLITNDYEKIGNWRNDKFTGWGREIKNNGEIFEGKFINDEINGKGFYKNSNGDLYIGEFSHSIKNGKGELFTKKLHYKGNFENNKISGNGKIEFIDCGHMYEGQFKNNQINGKGIFKWKNGDIYEGNMKDGKMDGKGIFKSENGFIYDGEFKDGIEEGYGKLKFPDGKIIEGVFSNGKLIKESRGSNNGVFYGYYQGNNEDFNLN